MAVESSTEDRSHRPPLILTNREPLGSVHHNVFVLAGDGVQMSIERGHREVLARLVHGHELKPDVEARVVAVAARCRYLVVVRAVVLAAADVEEVVDDGDARAVHADGRVAKARLRARLEVVADEVVVVAHHQLVTHGTHLTNDNNTDK